ncbi:MAG: pyruvate formate lyase family protein [Chloroflexota bacterium]|nr:pyruvate formate lyase family protein [Chloroflexota bacterium]
MMEQTTTKEDVREAWWWEAEKKRTSGLDYLRKAVWSKGTTGGKYLPGVGIGLERTYWWTMSFKETDGLPWVERRSRALDTYLRNMPIFIIDHSRLVGYHCERPNQVQYYVEVSRNNNEDLYYDPDKLIPEDEKEWIQACHAYWSNKCMQVLTERYLSQQEQIGIVTGPVMSGVHLDGSNSAVFDYDFVFENGLNGIISMIDEKINEAEKLLSTGPGTPNTLPLHEKIDEWSAMKLSVQAVIQWANRYSRLAKIIAENFETDPNRKAELLKMSDICAKVPASPVEHFHESIQCERFVGIAARFIERVHGGWAERLDQIYWPYYKKDVIEDKTLSREQAIELLGENNIRVYEVTGAVGRGFRAAFQGAPVHLPTITIGGVDENGRDASNDLTDAVLEACRLVRVSEPSYMFRYHPQVRLSTLKSAYETVRQGMGYPSFQHEGVCLDTLMHNFGATLEEARSYANVVCMSPGATKGRGGQGVRYAASFTNGYSSFMLAMFDGFEPFVMRMQIGPHTGDASTFQTFEEFFEAMRMQERFMYEMAARVRNKGRYMEARYLQQPFGSSLFKRCINSGMDMVDPRSEPLSNAWLTRGGGADIIDCLYSIKKLVFEDKKYTMAELQEALKSNWVGYAEMRQEFLNLPKFGNDIDEADEMAAKLYKMFAEECNRNVEAGGGKYMPLPEFASGWAAAAMMMGAMPNGRRQGDNLYDGGISPGAGFDKKGPTAVLRSVAKIDHRRLKQCLLNQRLSPSQLAGEKGFQLWMNYMKTWYDLNVPHVQFNMVDNETLRAAQREPEKYQELIVRVAGYSAHFVELNALTQEGIIERTIQEI